ncbi:MAG: hypothetical protein AMJ95_13280 [Omnitrophica WOR_2 bacterium SM23_72]|nr:MAG: hypothetical protein AMJ95_13280 [Omnitrophica WOR_2 bacterium SM23_72]
MKIAILLSQFPALSETFILDQVRELLEAGHDIRVFAKHGSRTQKTHADVQKYHLMEKAHYYVSIPRHKTARLFKALFLAATHFHKNPAAVFSLLNIRRYGNLEKFFFSLSFLNERFDILHCHFALNGLIGAALKESGIAKRCITNFHGAEINKELLKVNKNHRNNFFKINDLFIANTEFTRQQAIKLGCPGDKITVMPVGFQMDMFPFFEKALGPEEKIRILTVARLVEKKGHAYALRAVAQAVELCKNIEYIIAGDGGLRNDLENLTKSLKLEPYVKFLGWVNREEVLRLYQQSHLFILPSVTAKDGDREGQGLVLQEAQAAGLPVISTLHNGIPEGVWDGQSGFLVPEKDVDALSEKLKYLITHPEVWPQMGRSGRKFVEERYDSKRLSQQLLGIYNKILL